MLQVKELELCPVQMSILKSYNNKMAARTLNNIVREREIICMLLQMSNVHLEWYALFNLVK
jgi:hypothetical protein